MTYRSCAAPTPAGRRGARRWTASPASQRAYARQPRAAGQPPGSVTIFSVHPILTDTLRDRIVRSVVMSEDGAASGSPTAPATQPCTAHDMSGVPRGARISKPQRCAEPAATVEPNASCDIRVTITRAAGILDRRALRGKNTSSTSIFGAGWNARPPSSDLRVTTRAELRAVMRESDSGPNTQVRTGFAPGKQIATASCRRRRNQVHRVVNFGNR
jgi:hypothetical protein